jgi:hypothetical protein
MKKLKITFSLSKHVVNLLENRVPKRQRNVFIEEAIQGRFAMMEQEQFLRELAMHNRTRDEGLEQIDAGLKLKDTMIPGDDLLSESQRSEFDDLL